MGCQEDGMMVDKKLEIAEMAGMAGNGRKWLKMAWHGSNWLEMAGFAEMARIAENEWNFI